MSDIEIYIDSLAEMRIWNLNSYVSMMLNRIQLQGEIRDSEYYVRTLKASENDENE